MIGAIAGDIIGSTFERSIWSGGGMAARCMGYDIGPDRLDRTGAVAGEFELFPGASVPTDDSILTVAVMEWLLGGGELPSLLRSAFRRYPNAGFGSRFAEWAGRDDDSRCGSFGNGAAMRVSPVAYAAITAPEVVQLAEQSAVATHGTPDAIAGAQALALAIFLTRTGTSKAEMAAAIEERWSYDLTRSLDSLRSGYRFSSLCPETVPHAIRAYLEANSYEDAIRRAISLGGDSDTIAAMAGALAGAAWGVPEEVRRSALSFMDDAQRATVAEFEMKFIGSVK